jgi:hypothetical protein
MGRLQNPFLPLCQHDVHQPIHPFSSQRSLRPSVGNKIKINLKISRQNFCINVLANMVKKSDKLASKNTTVREI